MSTRSKSECSEAPDTSLTMPTTLSNWIWASWVIAASTSWSGLATRTTGSLYGTSQPAHEPKSSANSIATVSFKTPLAWSSRGRMSMMWRSVRPSISETARRGTRRVGSGLTPIVLAGPMYR